MAARTAAIGAARIMAAGTLTATCGAPLIVDKMAARRNGIEVVNWVVVNAMVNEAATTETTIKASTKRRARAKTRFENTLRDMALLRAAAVSHSTTGGKMMLIATTKCAGANRLLRQLRVRRTSLHRRVRGPSSLLILRHQRGEASRCSTRQPIAAFVPLVKMIISHGRASSIAVNRKFTPHH